MTPSDNLPASPQPPDTTQLIQLYLRTLTSPQTKKTYNTELRMFVVYAEEVLGKRISGISAEDISLYREHLLEKYSRATVAKKLAALRRFMTFAFMGGFTKVNPEALKFFAKSPKVSQDSAYNILNEDELSRMLNVARASSYRDYVILALMASCGLREAEVVGVTISDFRDSGYHSNGEDAILLRVRGKGDKVRNVPVAPDLWSLIQRFVIATGRSFTSHVDARRPLFESREGNKRPLTTRSIRYIVKKHVQRAGITKPISPHSIRHTVGTNMAVNEAPLLVIQQFLGHSDPKTTMRYIRRAEELASMAYQYNTLNIN